jgi:hypothetical protein
MGQMKTMPIERWANENDFRKRTKNYEEAREGDASKRTRFRRGPNFAKRVPKRQEEGKRSSGVLERIPRNLNKGSMKEQTQRDQHPHQRSRLESGHAQSDQKGDEPRLGSESRTAQKCHHSKRQH